LRHKHAAIHLHANGFPQFDPRAAAIRAVTLNRFAAAADIGEDGQGHQAQSRHCKFRQ
tara:strand:- start:329 stop:502 length:174 start_codon:yes stop_codon:yes gene_type:complete